MAIDNKYGRITMERGTVGENEPVIVFRAQDALLVDMLDHYAMLCEGAGSPQHHLELIADTKEKIIGWQEVNLDRVKVPTSNSFSPD